MKHQHPTPPSARASQSGVALIEVLISILLFSLGILGLIGLQARAISFSVDAEDRNRAALFANEIATSSSTSVSPRCAARAKGLELAFMV